MGKWGAWTFDSCLLFCKFSFIAIKGNYVFLDIPFETWNPKSAAHVHMLRYVCLCRMMSFFFFLISLVYNVASPSPLKYHVFYFLVSVINFQFVGKHLFSLIWTRLYSGRYIISTSSQYIFITNKYQSPKG